MGCSSSSSCRRYCSGCKNNNNYYSSNSGSSWNNGGSYNTGWRVAGRTSEDSEATEEVASDTKFEKSGKCRGGCCICIKIVNLSMLLLKFQILIESINQNVI